MSSVESSSKRPKTLAIIRSSYRPDGGAEQIISRMLVGLKRSYPVKVSLITKKWQNTVENSFTVLLCKKRGWFRHHKFLNFNKDVTKLLEHNRFDLVQSHERIPGCQIFRAGDGVHRQWLSIRRKKATPLQRLIWDHSLYHKAVLTAEKELFAHPKLEKVICNSAQIKRDILKHYPQTAAEKLVVIYNGIDLKTFAYKDQHAQQIARKKLGVAQEERILLFVGSGFQRKGLQTALEALNIAGGWKLIVVGKDKKTRYYQRLCQRLKIEDRVIFAGMQTDVKTYYAACDLLIHPAFYDPAPNVILEAMASGRGVIISDKCGNHELVKPNQNGYICKADNTQSLVSVLGSVTSKAHIRQLGKQARKTARQYPVTRMVDEFVQVYEQVLYRMRSYTKDVS